MLLGAHGDLRRVLAELDAHAQPLDPENLPLLGVRRRPERERASAYYLLAATPEAVEPHWTALLLTLTTPAGHRLRATLPGRRPIPVGRPCAVVLTVHPAPPGHGRVHRHVLAIRPLAPAAGGQAVLAAPAPGAA